jgi:cytochrome c-type biogenesis protein CcmH
MASSSDQFSPEQLAIRRRAYIAGMVILVAAVFGVGYVLGNRGPGAAPQEASAESASRPLPMPPPGLMGERAMGQDAPGAQTANLPRIEDLLPGLEKKVAADPKNIDNRILLARTFLALGKRDKGIATLRKLREDAPSNVDAVILLATTLMDSDNRDELKEAYREFDAAVRIKPAVSPMTHLYQGEVLVKLGDRKGAIAVWKDYLRTLPAGDQRRTPFEERIRAVSTG